MANPAAASNKCNNANAAGKCKCGSGGGSSIRRQQMLRQCCRIQTAIASRRRSQIASNTAANGKMPAIGGGNDSSKWQMQ